MSVPCANRCQSFRAADAVCVSQVSSPVRFAWCWLCMDEVSAESSTVLSVRVLTRSPVQMASWKTPLSPRERPAGTCVATPACCPVRLVDQRREGVHGRGDGPTDVHRKEALIVRPARMSCCSSRILLLPTAAMADQTPSAAITRATTGDWAVIYMECHPNPFSRRRHVVETESLQMPWQVNWAPSA